MGEGRGKKQEAAREGERRRQLKTGGATQKGPEKGRGERRGTDREGKGAAIAETTQESKHNTTVAQVEELGESQTLSKRTEGKKEDGSGGQEGGKASSG